MSIAETQAFIDQTWETLGIFIHIDERMPGAALFNAVDVLPDTAMPRTILAKDLESAKTVLNSVI